MQEVPIFLVEEIRKMYKEEYIDKIISGYSKKRKTTFRVNTLKSTAEKVEHELMINNIDYERVVWCKEAFVLKNNEESTIQQLDIYKNGEIYVQSLSSMLPAIILNPKSGEDILDMTAAPGSKTTQMAMISNNNSNITACEINNVRAERLKFNIEKQGASCVYVMKKDARKIDDFFSFDKILLDSPCSGSGTISTENENLNKVFTQILVEKSIKIQKELIKKAIKILKPGKEMVYSTCSILKSENEDIVNTVLNENVEIVPIDFEGKENLPLLPTKIQGTLCLYPNEYYEGFFVAKLRKKHR